jgi:hypothetical protein
VTPRFSWRTNEQIQGYASEHFEIVDLHVLERAGDRGAGRRVGNDGRPGLEVQPAYCATIFEKSYGLWLTLLHEPSAQLCGTLGSQARSRLSDQ